MATKKKPAPTPVTAAPQPRLDVAGWELCLGDRVNAVPDTQASTVMQTAVGLLDHFDADYTFCHVALEDRPGLVRVACAQLRWEMPAVLDRPTAPRQRVRVVIGDTGQASEELKSFEGQLAWTVSFDYAKEGLSVVTVRFQDAAFEPWPTAINSTDLLVVPVPVSHYRPEPTPAAEPAPMAVVTVDEPDAPVRVSMQAWDLLETLDTCGGLVPHANLSSVGAQALLGELMAAGLAEPAGRDYRLTPAGEAALKEAATEPAPVAEAAPAPAESAPTPAATPPELPAANVQLVRIDNIIVTSNTRKVFDEAALQELADSIKAHGLLHPIVVRRIEYPGAPEGYELVAGERRYRAAKLAGQQWIQASVRTFTDREFLEVQITENLQRVDVRPADEAVGFAKLLANNFSAEEISQRVGKPVKFVLQRAKLVNLIPFWLGLLETERLPLVAAHELARLPQHGQVLVRKWMEQYKSWELKQTGSLDASSIRHAITQEVTRQLNSAAFPKADAALCREAGACTACSKNSANHRGLFDDLVAAGKPATCLDGACFTRKKELFVKRRLQELAGTDTPLVSESYDQPPKGALGYKHYSRAKEGDKGVVRALFVDGSEAGTMAWVKLSSSASSAQSVDPAAAKAERDAAIQANRLKRMQNELWAEKLRDTFADELYSVAGSNTASTQAAAHALLDHWLRRAFTFGRTRTPNDLLSYLTSHYAWEEPTQDELNNAYSSEENAHTRYLNRQLANMPSLLLKLSLFFDLKIRDGLEQTEYTSNQENLVKVLPKSYKKAFQVQAEAEQRVAERYGKKKKGAVAA